MNVTSEEWNIEGLIEKSCFFSVPIYQRLYVWGDEQVRTLLEDLLTAFRDKPEEIFYLGGVLVKEFEGSGGRRTLELIDGQQRFTTLWMMSLVRPEVHESGSSVWQNALHGFQRDEETGRPRVSFAIRPAVERFFAEAMAGQNEDLAEERQLVTALEIIKSFFHGLRQQGDQHATQLDLSAFTRFIATQVKIVMTRVPEATDLNKLFEVINNRGVQLQHHEILKARMLSKLLPEERDSYAKLWDACAEMNNFVEKNLRNALNRPIAKLYSRDAAETDSERLGKAEAVLEELEGEYGTEGAREPLMLEQILAGEGIADGEAEEPEPSEEGDMESVRSIVSFSMLLQHTLRIWLHRNSFSDIPRILDKELLAIFKECFPLSERGREDVKSFIALLWDIRYCFDKHVIKWVSGDDGNIHMILRPRLAESDNYSSLVRESKELENDRSFSLLQSMLYHSQQITTHYWLTPLLAYILENRGQPRTHEAFLCHLDNHMLSALEDASLIERSWNFLKNPWRDGRPDCSILNQPEGLHFSHYWFYKLEFILWDTFHATEGDEWKSFRMTAKNSIEHISPQTAQASDVNTVSAKMLNRFGNLALVSRSINSEYGNKPYNEKRLHFLNRNTSRLDSLKMARIYQSVNWGDVQAEQHEREMIALIEDYIHRDNRVTANA